MYRDFSEPGPSSGAGSGYGGPAQPPGVAQAAAQQVRASGTPRVPLSDGGGVDARVDRARDAGVSSRALGAGAENPFVSQI